MLCKFWPAAIYFNMKSDQNFPIDQTLSARCLFQLHYAINFVCEHFSFDLSVGSVPLAQLSETSAERNLLGASSPNFFLSISIESSRGVN
jgi:hypothetical protein